MLLNGIMMFNNLCSFQKIKVTRMQLIFLSQVPKRYPSIAARLFKIILKNR